MTFGVTGARGYVGARLVRRFREAGKPTIAFSRQPDAADAESAAFSFERGADTAALRRVNVLVHAAYDFDARTPEEIHRQNVNGAIRLFEEAARCGVRRFVLISTMSAFEGCRSEYGRAKLALEAWVRRAGGSVVRPGLVHGPKPGGMVGALTRAATLPIVPLPSGGSQLLYLAHEQDVAALVLRLAESDAAAPEPIVAANDQPWRLAEILRAIAAARRKTPVIVPMPWRGMWLGLRAAETLGLRIRLRSDSVVSLVNQDPQPNFEPLRRSGLAFRPFTAEGLQVA